MRNKKGFTLIELLVVIALMLSILGIAVVSLINISNKKKKESWEQVKGQIETAAVEYFTANEYLFEGLQNGSIGTISVGKLVSEDYLNKVTNPDTGKAVSMCALVNITKDGEKYNATFDNTSTESQVAQCESNNIITVSEPGAPEFDIKDTCKNKSGSDIAKQNEYCYSETFSVDNSKEKYKPHGKITSKKYCVGTGTSCNTDTEFTDSFDGAAETEENGVVGITLINQSGAKTTKYKDYKIDRTAPTGTVTLSRSSGVSYNSNTPKLTINTNDNESGLSTASFNNAKNPTSGKNSWNISGRNWNPTVNNFVIYKGPGLKNQYKNGSGDTIGEGTVNLTVTDKVGNVGILRNNKYVLYSKCSKITKTVSEGEYGSCSAACGGGTKTRTDTTNVKDKYISGVSCPGDGATNKVTAKCNTQGCCSKTKETGKVSWGSWSSCDKNNKKKRTGTVATKSSYDDSSCGTETKTDTASCSRSYVSCKTSEIETDCESSSGKHILGRLYVKCDRPVKQIKIHYYYEGGSSGICSGVSKSTAVYDIKGGSWSTGSDAKNASYFNFRGCGSTKLRYKVIVISLDGTTTTYKPEDGWYDFNFSESKKYSACNPKSGGIWVK